MATADQIKMLVEAHVLKNEDRFKTIVLQLAAYEAKQGHTSFARDLRKILDKNNKDTNVRIIEFSKDINELIHTTVDDYRLSELIVEEEIKERIHRILNEYRLREKLKKFGMFNRRKVLLEGPPGTGKTMTASIIASEIGFPLCTVKMDKLMTKFMGETGTKLRLIFDAIQENTAVYFFDEFDAIGTDRNKDNDVGEVRRVLNLFLQFIEQDDSESIIIAATNNSKLLDPALFRRFDDVIHFTLPRKEQIPNLIMNGLGQFAPENLNFNFEELESFEISLSHAELTKACDDSVKEAIMNDRKTVDNNLLLKMLKEKIRVHE